MSATNLHETERCRFLRAKNAYGTTEGGDNPFLPADTGTTTYWCLKTCLPMGPDGGLAVTTRCGRGRTCFEAIREGREVPV